MPRLDATSCPTCGWNGVTIGWDDDGPWARCTQCCNELESWTEAAKRKLAADRAVRRCQAAVPRKAKDYDGPVPLLAGTPPDELVVDQCRKAAAEGSVMCGQHRAVKGGSVSLVGDFNEYLD